MDDLSLLERPARVLSRAHLGLPGRPDHGYEVLGELPPAPRLAVVGSRAAHRSFLGCLPAILGAAKARGWSLVSGGALGIDGGAHRVAMGLDVAQLAVLPCGRDRPYPPGHASLFAAMVADPRAALLFAQAPGRAPTRGMFASRNAIVVGLARGVIVVEARLRSGSMGTGRAALRCGVALAAVVGSRGAGALVAQGAMGLPGPGSPSLARAVEDFLGRAEREPGEPGARVSSGQGSLDFGAPAWPEELEDLSLLLGRAGPAGLSIDACSEPEVVLAQLCEAELMGLVTQACPGRWVALGSGPREA